MLDPPVPSAPTLISLPPQPAIEADESDSRTVGRHQPGTLGRLLGATIMAPAALFSGIGFGVEKLAGALQKKKPEPAVRVTRTRQ
jgi:hypothetical protein